MVKNSKYYVSRVLAFYIDYFLICFSGLIIFIVLVLFSEKFGGDKYLIGNSKLSYIVGGTIIQCVGFGLHTFYLIYIQGKYSTTLGKKLFGLKVVKINGSNLDIRTATIRYFSYLLSFATFGIGMLFILFDKNNQALHDKIAKTYVVFDR